MKKIFSLFLIMILFGIINAQSIPKVVISGVYGGGGNSAATYKNDYVELYNTTSTNINLAGYTLYYSPAAGGTNQSVTKNNTFTFPTGAIIEAKGFVLIKASAGTEIKPDWPIPFDYDASGDKGTNFAMAAASGRILLLSTFVDLSPNNSFPSTWTLSQIQAMAGYMDYMPYGKTAVPVFGSATVDLSASKAASRKYNGTAITYTFDVGKDFSIITADENAPRNSSYGNSDRVATPTFNPAGGSFDAPVNVTISCATAGATIRYTIDGSEPTASSSVYSSTISVNKQTTIQAKAWKDGMEPSKIGSATFNYPQPVSTLAALRALAPTYNEGVNEGNIVYQYTGQAVVTQIQNHNNIKYIQDKTAAIMIFDPAGNLQPKLELGDLVTNIKGKITNYFGMLEFIPIEGNCTQLDCDHQVNTIKINATQLDYNPVNPIQAKIVTLENVSFVQTGNFATGKYYNLKQNNVVYDSLVYTDNYDADYINTQIPTIAKNITGVCLFKGGTGIKTKNRIVMLNTNNNVAGITNYNPSAIKLAPNPASNYVNIITGVAMKLEIYSLLGNLIATDHLYEGQNTISVSNYPAGVYIMKMIDVSNGQTNVQKLVVK